MFIIIIFYDDDDDDDLCCNMKNSPVLFICITALKHCEEYQK